MRAMLNKDMTKFIESYTQKGLVKSPFNIN